MARTERIQVRVTMQQRQRMRRSIPLPQRDAALSAQAEYLFHLGLLLVEARAVASGEPPPPGLSPDQLAAHVAQELIGVLPLLQRTGHLAALGRALPVTQIPPTDADHLDDRAADDVADLTGGSFL